MCGFGQLNRRSKPFPEEKVLVLSNPTHDKNHPIRKIYPDRPVDPDTYYHGSKIYQ